MAGKSPEGYVFQAFPKCKYHEDGRGCVVKDAGEELALGPGWHDRPQPVVAPISEGPEAPVAPALVPKRRGRPPKERLT